MKIYDLESNNVILDEDIRHVEELTVIIKHPDPINELSESTTIGWKGKHGGKYIGAWMEVPADDLGEILQQLCGMPVKHKP